MVAQTPIRDPRVVSRSTSTEIFQKFKSIFCSDWRPLKIPKKTSNCGENPFFNVWSLPKFPPVFAPNFARNNFLVRVVLPVS